jgi:hypothetical protein
MAHAHGSPGPSNFFLCLPQDGKNLGPDTAHKRPTDPNKFIPGLGCEAQARGDAALHVVGLMRGFLLGLDTVGPYSFHSKKEKDILILLCLITLVPHWPL